MTLSTSANVPISDAVLSEYFKTLINHFFKILPLWEDGESSLTVYMSSLQCELLGCQSLIHDVHGDAMMISLVSILQYLIDTPDCNVSLVKREVFRAISICNKLKERFLENGQEVRR